MVQPLLPTHRCMFMHSCVAPTPLSEQVQKKEKKTKQNSKIKQLPHNQCTKGIWLCKNLFFLSQKSSGAQALISLYSSQFLDCIPTAFTAAKYRVFFIFYFSPLL